MNANAIDSTDLALLDYLGSDPANAWTLYRDLSGFELLYNFGDDRRFVSLLVRRLESQGLVEVRRSSSGMQLRLTVSGLRLNHDRRQELDSVYSSLHWPTDLIAA